MLFLKSAHKSSLETPYEDTTIKIVLTSVIEETKIDETFPAG